MIEFPTYRFRVHGGVIEQRLFTARPIPRGWHEDKFKARAAARMEDQDMKTPKIPAAPKASVQTGIVTKSPNSTGKPVGKSK